MMKKNIAISLSALILGILLPMSLVQKVEAAAGASVVQETEVPAKIFILPTIGKITRYFQAGHYALDIANSKKPAVWAAGDGVVLKASSGTWGGGYGNHVIIDHGNGLRTLYGHLQTVTVKTGDMVKKGDVIGKMGRTGNVKKKDSTHLHFEVIKGAVKQNPLDYIANI